MGESMKEQIDREYKEIDECKKDKVEEKKDKTTKKTSTDYKSTGLDRVISPCKQQETKDGKQLTSTPNEPILSNSMSTAYKMLSTRSGIINSEIPIIPKLVF